MSRVHLFGRVYGWNKQDVLMLTPQEAYLLEEYIYMDNQKTKNQR